MILPGDFDWDHDIDGRDFSDFAHAFGSVQGDPNYNPAADFDGNGAVDVEDLEEFAAVFGKIYGQ